MGGGIRSGRHITSAFCLARFRFSRVAYCVLCRSHFFRFGIAFWVALILHASLSFLFAALMFHCSLSFSGSLSFCAALMFIGSLSFFLARSHFIGPLSFLMPRSHFSLPLSFFFAAIIFYGSLLFFWPDPVLTPPFSPLSKCSPHAHGYQKHALAQLWAGQY